MSFNLTDDDDYPFDWDPLPTCVGSGCPPFLNVPLSSGAILFLIGQSVVLSLVVSDYARLRLCNSSDVDFRSCHRWIWAIALSFSVNLLLLGWVALTTFSHMNNVIYIYFY